MSNEAEILPNLLREENFEITMRGYNRHQVDEYIARTRSQVRDLETRLTRALDEAERSRRQVADARDAKRPTGDELGDRLRQIINLAEEEAQEKLAEAERRVTHIRKDAEREAKRVVDEARGKSEKTLAEAQENASKTLSAAKKEADRIVSDASEEAEQTVTSARVEAERTLTAAEQRSGVINEAATERLTALTGQHSQVIQRMTEMSQTLSTLLSAEAKAGPLEKMITDAARQGKPSRPGSRTIRVPAPDLESAEEPRIPAQRKPRAGADADAGSATRPEATRADTAQEDGDTPGTEDKQG